MVCLQLGEFSIANTIHPGGVAFIDSFCWLHDVGRGLGRTLYRTPQVGRQMVMNSFIALVDLVRTCQWIAHPVFDGGPSPAKVTEDSIRRNRRQTSLQQALDLEDMGLGTTETAHKLYNDWWRPSPELVHQICIALSARCIPFTVAPYEADSQLSFLCNMYPGRTIAITKDSDAAVTIENVFFWDKRYDALSRIGGGLYCIRSQMIDRKDGKYSMQGFTDDQVILTCVIGGCDYVNSTDHARGVGFVKAVAIVREHKTLDNVVQHITTCGKYKVSPDTARATRAAFYQFKYPVVYDAGTGSHVHRTPIPDEQLILVKEALGGDLEGLGHIWPRRVAQNISNSVCHPVTRLPFDSITRESEATVPRGGVEPRRAVLLGGRLEASLRRLPPPKMMAPGADYDAALKRCGVTVRISPTTEITEKIMQQVLRLRECDAPGADLFSDGTRTEQESLDHFVANQANYNKKQLDQWLRTRHLSRTTIKSNGKTQDMSLQEMAHVVLTQLKREVRDGRKYIRDPYLDGRIDCERVETLVREGILTSVNAPQIVPPSGMPTISSSRYRYFDKRLLADLDLQAELKRWRCKFQGGKSGKAMQDKGISRYNEGCAWECMCAKTPRLLCFRYYTKRSGNLGRQIVRLVFTRSDGRLRWDNCRQCVAAENRPWCSHIIMGFGFLDGIKSGRAISGSWH